MGRSGRPKIRDTKVDRHDVDDVMIRVRKEFVAPLHVLVQRLGAGSYTELVHVALREYLERLEMWPPRAPIEEQKAAAEEYLKALGLLDKMVKMGLWPK